MDLTSTNASPSQNRRPFVLRAPERLADQIRRLKAVPTDDIPVNVQDCERICFQGKEYILESWVGKKNKRKSWIGDHGTWLRLVRSDIIADEFWACNYCDSILNVKATSAAAHHLKKNHSERIPKDDDEEEGSRGNKRQKTIAGAWAAQQPTALLIPHIHSWKDDLIGWIVDRNIPFAEVEDVRFRRILKNATPDLVDSVLPKSKKP